ncbi:MAG: hypothetical protein WBB46_01535, partial [Candidatus Deferrimicrobiaceae bacterium]
MKGRGFLIVALTAMLAATFAAGDAQAAITCEREVTANIVAIDQPVLFNRLGASNVNGMIFALRRDVINMTDNLTLNNGGAAEPGNVMLRPDKRPRPLVLRVREGDCLTVNLENLLALAPNPNNAVAPPQFNVLIDEQVADRHVSFHVSGLQLVDGIYDDASYVGQNPAGGDLVIPGFSATYKLYAEHEGVYTAMSYGALTGSDGNMGNVSNLLFGEVIVEPKGARIYRSGVTEEEMRLATIDNTADGHPIIDYEAVYPAVVFLDPPVNEIQTITDNAIGGTFTLTFGGFTTDPIAFDASATAVEVALEALPSITDVTVVLTVPQSWEITFLDPGNQDVALLVATDSLTSGLTTVAELTPGFAGTPNVW